MGACLGNKDQCLELCAGALALLYCRISSKLLSLSESHLPHCKIGIRSPPCCREGGLGETLCLGKEGLVNIIPSQFPHPGFPGRYLVKEAQAVRDVKLLGFPSSLTSVIRKEEGMQGGKGNKAVLG